ncbi:MAG: shikimate dehydrogenase [Litorivicinus sp.]
MSARLAVIGDPIEHSKSPAIHAAFGQQCGIDLDYQKIQVAPAALTDFLDQFFSSGGRGLNVTVPHKEAAYQWVKQHAPAARVAGACNTLIAPADGSSDAVVGDNTDGAGLVLDLKRLGVKLTDARVLMLGAGGAARGAMGPLLAEGPAMVSVFNRTQSRAQALTEQCGGRVWTPGDAAFDLVIGATSAGLSGQAVNVPSGAIGANTLVYDMMYGAEPTALMQAAIAAGAVQVEDGLGMLVGQAAEAFERWFGVLPDSAPVLAQLRRAS